MPKYDYQFNEPGWYFSMLKKERKKVGKNSVMKQVDRNKDWPNSKLNKTLKKVLRKKMTQKP